MLYHVHRRRLTTQLRWLMNRLQALYGTSAYLAASVRTNATTLLRSENPTEQLEGLRRILQLETLLEALPYVLA